MENFKYFALMYLNDWQFWDKPFSERIFSNDDKDSLDAFHHAAKYYKVTRNFPIDASESRLQAALDLVSARRGALTEKNVCQTVDRLASEFESRYGKNAISAASKFLWLRHKSPVVIFDSRARKWLNKNGYKVPANDYTRYRQQWLCAFVDHRAEIDHACSGLVNVLDYSMAHDEDEQEVSDVVSSLWFQERVFDKFLWFNADN